MVKYTLKEKIVKFLIENKEEHSIMEISKILNIDYKNTFQAFNQLSSNVYKKTKQGNMNLIKFNPQSSLDILTIEEKRTQEFLLNNQKLRLIKNIAQEMNYPFMILLIFGSYTKKTNTKKSDIDICLISDNEKIKKRLIQELSLLSLKLEIHDFTTQEFKSMIEKKKDNLGNEIIKNNIILYGIENYYNLISK